MAQCPKADAGPDIAVCAGSDATLAGVLPAGFTGTWSEDALFTFLQQGSITDNSNPNSTVTGLNNPETVSEIWTIDDGAGCTSKDTVDIMIQTAPPWANAGQDQTICLGDPLTLNALPGPIGSLGEWSKNSGTNSSSSSIADPADAKSAVTGLNQAGTDEFVWTVSNAACAVAIADTVLITSGAIPSQAEAGNDQVACVGDTLTLIGSIANTGDPIWSRDGINGGNINNVRFATDANNDTVKVALNNEGVYKMYYTVSVGPTNLNSPCTTRDSLTLTVNAALKVDAGIDQISCDGSTTTFTVLGNKPAVGAGQWALIGAPSGSVNLTSDTIGTVTGLSPGINTLAWQVTDNVCIATDYMTIAVGPPATAEAGSNLAGCIGDTVQLIGNNAGSFQPLWELGAGVSRFFDASLVPNGNNDTVGLRLRGAGTFKIYYSIALGTKGDAASCLSKDSMEVSISAAPTNANISGSNTITSCDTATFTLNGNVPGAGEVGIWTVSGSPDAKMDTSTASTLIISGLSQGTTTITWTISNAGGCSTNDVATITIGASAGPDKIACVGDTAFQISGSNPQGGTPLWSTQGSSIASIVGSAATANVTLSISGTGTVNMLYTVIDGACVSTDTMTLTTDVTCLVEISEEVKEVSELSVYPNPTSGTVFIVLNDVEQSLASISVLSLEGRTVISKTLGEQMNIQAELDLNGVSAGIYFVKVQKGTSTFFTKLVKQ